MFSELHDMRMDRTRRTAIVGHFLLVFGVCTLFVDLLMIAEHIDYRGVQTTFTSTPLADTTLWRVGATFLAGVALLAAGEYVLRAHGPWPVEGE